MLCNIFVNFYFVIILNFAKFAINEIKINYTI